MDPLLNGVSTVLRLGHTWFGFILGQDLVDILSVPFLHSFEWLMVQSMDTHALLPSLLGGLLGLLLFPTSAFYFHSSN